MNTDRALSEWLRGLRGGSLSRREFTRALLGLGLVPPLIAELPRPVRPADAQPRRTGFTPSRRGGGGDLKLLWWQAPTILNPHLAIGVKDGDGSRIFYEPLVSFDPDGNSVPVLAAELPTLQNGGIARDGLSVTVKLKKGVQWHDGKPFTADDVVFTWEYAADQATTAVSSGAYRDIARIDRLDQHTVKIVYKTPNPFWANAFRGVIPKHVFEPFKGARSREAPANLRPIGTGPYRFVDFKPGDLVRAELFSAYHEPNWPFFDRLEMKGGGDAVSAARAVIQTGEYDFAWNMQVEDDVLRRMEQGGKGRVDIAWGGQVEHILCNFSDPLKEVDGERSSLKAPHPFMTDAAVRSALSLVVDRASIQEQIYGRLGQTTANYLNAPTQFRSRNTRWEFSVEKANKVLEDAGWRRGPDGIRTRDGKRLRMLFQTSINAPRQKTQAIVKQAAARAGIEMELKSVVPAVYFSTDPANLDTSSHFTADLQMYSFNSGSPDPQRFMDPFVSWEIAQKENKWAGRNSTRWRNEEYDRSFKAAETEMDPLKRAAHFIRMNDLLAQNVVVVPFLWRGNASAVSNRLRGTEISGWDSNLWNIAHWYKEP
ncbi:MAG: peptide ABC transporter substrate-binding protein [Candidatus Rokuibacteriota bacterium]|nr:MAG: peptide ABC transporter substrate-binding protein [Candidatus Rokubacteria bacterium]